ncbi:MAG: hypothetical protein UV70_C0005G0063 [Parcubacteria group bacterium GW2011_GWA2_43_13]|nr:MAG: hypothetical protein UV70_C0005G0063 [Parcubacteria group bacterium GW2011_GWA2_43_13]
MILRYSLKDLCRKSMGWYASEECINQYIEEHVSIRSSVRGFIGLLVISVCFIVFEKLFLTRVLGGITCFWQCARMCGIGSHRRSWL